ncbi:MAG: PIG-L family deacetylase, partial [Terracidiphilus sp.]
MAGRAPDPFPQVEPSPVALPLPEDRGAAGLEQACRRLQTTASVMMIVAHPDDEDGALLTYLARGLGARVTLFTLTRGEGGQNAMSADSYDALGVIRTNELVRAGEFYGVRQLWGTEADFGFSKTQEESFARWGHDRVLYDAVLAVRRERPQVIVATFVGAVSDGHGQHQVSGEIAQEVFKAAADPKVFPEQLRPVSQGGMGLAPWQVRAVYSMVPFAQIKDGKIFDYATGKWVSARIRNYVTGEWIDGEVLADVRINVGQLDPVLGRSYAQIARQGWGEQKSQNGGANPALSGPVSTSYHLWAVAPESAAEPAGSALKPGTDLFHNSKVRIDTGVDGLARMAEGKAPEWLASGFTGIAAGLADFEAHRRGLDAVEAARTLAPVYGKMLALRETLTDFLKVNPNGVDPAVRATLLLELDAKIEQAQAVLRQLLGLDLAAFTARAEGGGPGGPFRGAQPDETAPSVSPGEEFRVRVHAAQATAGTRLARVWLESAGGAPWPATMTSKPWAETDSAVDATFTVRAADDARPTQPYFTRPNIEQPWYDLTDPALNGRSFVPWPLNAWAEFTFEGQPIRLGQVVQTMQRTPGPGGVLKPLVVTPLIGLRVDPEARILPL